MAIERHRRGVTSEVYVSLFEDSVDGILLTAADGSIFAANRAACRLLGWTEEEICGLGRTGVADVTDERWTEGVETRRRDGYFRGELRMRRADGSAFLARLSSAMFLDAGELRSYVSFQDTSDSVELRENAAAGRRAAASVVETLETVGEAYLAVDGGWNLSYVNRRAEQLLGVARASVLGTELWRVFPHLRGTAFERHYRDVMRTGEAVAFEGYDAALDLRCEVRAYPLSGGGLGLYVIDIADRYAVEQERERLLAAERVARAAAELAQVELAHRATHDSLTGLLNRSGLLEEVAAAVAADPDLSLTVLFIDLDRFKLVNDTLGHATGDELLAVVAQRLDALAQPGEILARFGGDEFVLAVPNVTVAEASALAALIVTASREPVPLGDHSLLVTASVGLARAGETPDLGVLLREADAAMYSAKEAGREGSAWFDERLHARAVNRVRLEQGLRRALDRSELVLDYQPSFELQTGTTTHVEALARWYDPERGWIPPAEFIPVAEESGLILRLGESVIAQAAAQAAAWAHVPDLRVWVNVSPLQLATPGLADVLAAHLDRAGVPPDRFGIEVTESTLGELGQFTRELRAVRALGVAIAVDDFGTGFSSLARLVQMPVDVIKVDRSFVAMLGTPRGDALLAGIITLAHSIGAYVIAEGVETRAQLGALAVVGCEAAAGFLLARPGPAEAVPWLTELDLPFAPPDALPLPLP